MSDPISLLTQLQKMDKELTSLRQEGSDKQAFLDQSESQTAELEIQAKNHVDEHTLIQKERRSLESQVSGVVEKITKLKGQTLEVKTNREYSALLEETKNLESQKDEAETKILEHMEEEEKLGQIKAQAQGSLEKEKQKLETLTREVHDQRAALDKQLQEKSDSRQKFASSIPAQALHKYDSIRAIRDGVALALIEGTLCSECSVNLPPQLKIQVRKNVDLVLCPSCSRILCRVIEETAKPSS